MTLCESVRFCVARKRSFDGCGFRSGCPVVSAHSCDTLNHAVITHAHRCLHGHGTHKHKNAEKLHVKTDIHRCIRTLSCFFEERAECGIFSQRKMIHSCLARIRSFFFSLLPHPDRFMVIRIVQWVMTNVFT